MEEKPPALKSRELEKGKYYVPLLEGCLQHHGHKGDIRVTPGTSTPLVRSVK